jgi:hypothetical protein
LRAAALIGVGAALGFGVVVVNAGAQSPPPSNNMMLNVPGNAIGQPQPFRIAAGGFTPGAQVFVEQCDGNPPTMVGWSPTQNCDLGTSPAGVIVPASGVATFQPDDPNHAFHPFKGQSPQALFNCLSPHEAPLSAIDFVPDYENCQIRVSTSNFSVTADQQFFDLTLPDAPWETPFAVQTGSCTGQRILGSWKPLALTNTATAGESLNTALMTDVTTPIPHPKIAGTCTLPGSATPVTPKAFALKVIGAASCKDTATTTPLIGKLSITMNEIDPATGLNFKILAVVRRIAAVDPSAPDIVAYTGTVTGGEALGSTIKGTMFEDPIAKAPKGVVTTTGFVDAHNVLTQCQAGTASISTFEMGAGLSKFGGTATGFVLGY